MPDVKLSQLLANSPASVAAGAALWTHKGHIEGLPLRWDAVNGLTVGSGSAWIQSLGYAVDVPNAISKAGLSLSATTWYHVYLYLNAGVPDVEHSTTAPAAAYSGTARSKTGDSTRRYLGSFLTDGSSNIRKFEMVGSRVVYLADVRAAPFRVVSNGVATSWTSFSLTTVVPVTATAVNAVAQNASATGVGCEISSGATGTDFVYTINPTQAFPSDFAMGASQTLNYRMMGASALGFFFDVWSYVFAR